VNLLSLNRWKASAIHLTGSALIATTIVVLMLALWYPGAYFTAMGGQMLVVILVGVDVVLGPLITLIIFDPKKKSLKFDLGAIVVVQLAALAYGCYVMFEARPVYNVFIVDRFDLIAANQLPAEMLERGPPEFRSLPLTGPKIIATRRIDDPKRQLEITMNTLNGGKDLSELPEFYVPYSQYALQAGARARPLAELEKKQPSEVETIRKFVRDSGRKADQIGFLPMKARNQDMTVVVEIATGDIVGFLPVEPW
jgi:hypothetical protein